MPTCVPPHRQVLVLLDVQHDLQAVARPSLHGGAERLPLLGSVEHVAFTVAGENLAEDTEKRELYQTLLFFFLFSFLT